METAPASSLGLLLAFGMLTFAMTQLLDGPAGFRLPRNDELSKVIVIGIFMVMTAGAMAWTVRTFRRSCSGKRGWLRALLSYYLCALLMVIGVVGLIASCAAVTRSMGTAANGSIQDAAAIAVQIVLATGIPVWIWWTYRMAWRGMTRLQREVAVATAKRVAEERRKQLAALTEHAPASAIFRRQT